MRAARLTPTRPVSSIRIGTRHRRDLGDVAVLAASMDEYGLLHPVVVRPDGELVAGLRRLHAWQRSRWRAEPIPVHVVDIAAVAAGELAENALRKDLTPSEMVALMRDVLPAIQEASRQRQAELGRHQRRAVDHDPSGQFARKGATSDRESRTLAARLVGCSPRTLAKAAQVVDAAAADPARYGRLLDAMDRSGKVDGPFSRLVVMRQADRIRLEPPPMPGRGPYRVGSVDFPWPFDREADDQSERGTHPYPLMTYRQIEAFLGREILPIMHADAVLPLWTTNFHMPATFRILAACGLEHKTILTWVKDKIGRGRILREKTEHCIIATRGRVTVELSGESTELRAPRLAHSEKPAAYYDLIERVFPAPRYACLFSHAQRRPNWDSHSTELDETPIAAELAQAASAQPGVA